MNHLESFRQIHTFIFDVDGVLTDSRIIVLEDGKLLHRINQRDELAIRTAVEREYKVVILSGGTSPGLRERLSHLGVTDLYFGTDDKLEAYDEVVDLYELDEEGILYMGDDWPDYQTMRRVGLPVCPKDAIPEIIKISKYVSPLTGGAGCVRDVIEKVLRLHDNWMTT
jgi:3-deoxy-D-manno-octulosonate 8-phosphate phosphatase (KDO 8-P phosphatase)